MLLSQIKSDFLRYLLSKECIPGTRLPSLSQISQETGVSVGKLREQLEVARLMGLVDVRPRRGIEYTGYRLLPAVRQSLLVALSLDEAYFAHISSLRAHIESSFWAEATQKLLSSDIDELFELVRSAWAKLNQARIQIPHSEHRAFHLTIFRRLDNPFVFDLLEAYWDAYEAVELNTYADYRYLTAVWNYHEEIASALREGDLDQAKSLQEAHIGLLSTRGQPSPDVHRMPNGTGTSNTTTDIQD